MKNLKQTIAMQAEKGLEQLAHKSPQLCTWVWWDEVEMPAHLMEEANALDFTNKNHK